jgi:hypothetical protein
MPENFFEVPEIFSRFAGVPSNGAARLSKREGFASKRWNRLLNYGVSLAFTAGQPFIDS